MSLSYKKPSVSLVVGAKQLRKIKYDEVVSAHKEGKKFDHEAKAIMKK